MRCNFEVNDLGVRPVKTTIHRSLLITSLLVSPLAHAQDNTGKAPAAPATTPAQPPAGGMMGGRGMMGSGHMMGQDGMMSGGAMMGDGMPMMGMMINHADGYLAFLKTELKITDAQLPQWNAFADAERANAKGMRDMMAAMVANRGLGTFPERLALHEKLMTTRLDELRKEKGAADALYAALNDEQKKVADELLSRSMGMM
jgi:hypothetical protein